MTLRIELLPLQQDVPCSELLPFAGSGRVLTCDFYVAGIEQAEPAPWGFIDGVLENIDHHAPVPAMARPLSSVHLALRRLEALGPAEAHDTVLINHTDCDSVLTAGLVAGLLPPEEKLAAAALAADHTGTEDPIADLLQGIERRRDFGLSIRNLMNLLWGRPLDAVAQAGIEERQCLRDMVTEAVIAGRFERVGAVMFGVFNDELYGEFLTAYLPQATVIVTATPHPQYPDRWAMKVRLGAAAPAGLTLQVLDLRNLDPAYGGRWNAGSNKRGGGSLMAPRHYAIAVDKSITAALAA